MKLLTIPDAADALNVPEGLLRKKVSAREVPFTRLGRHIRFTDDHLNAIVADGEQPAVVVPKLSGVSRRARRAVHPS